MSSINSTLFTITASTFRATNSHEDNMKLHIELFNKLQAQGLNPVEVIGSYHEEGQPAATVEHSIMLSNLPWTTIGSFKALFIGHYFQDSILAVNETNQRAILLGNDWAEHIGTYKQVTKEVALSSVCYTYNASNNSYWLAA